MAVKTGERVAKLEAVLPLLQEKVGEIDTKLDLLITNHFPTLQMKVESLEVRVGIIGAVAAVIGSAIVQLIFHFVL